MRINLRHAPQSSKWSTLALAASIALAAGAGPASAFEAKVSGQVDRALTYADNGKQSDIASVDNNGSNSRFRFTGTQKMDNGMKLGMIYEIGLDQMPSTDWDIGQNSNGSVHLDSRKMDTYLQGDFGKFSFGKGDGAAYYAGTMDLSGTDYVGGGVWYELYSSGIHFVDSNGNSLYTVGKTQDPFNALHRVNRVRYDSPSLHGLTLSTSFDNGRAYELAARYSVNLNGGGKFIAGTSWSDSEREGIEKDPGTGATTVDESVTRKKVYNASASLLLSNGLNFTVTAARQKTPSVVNSGAATQKGYDATTVFGQVGYIVGRNHFAVNYGQTKDLPADGVKGSQVGLAYVFDWTKAVQMYASYHLYKLDLTQQIKTDNGWGDAKDINQLYIGTRIKFL